MPSTELTELGKGSSPVRRFCRDSITLSSRPHPAREENISKPKQTSRDLARMKTISGDDEASDTSVNRLSLRSRENFDNSTSSSGPSSRKKRPRPQRRKAGKTRLFPPILFTLRFSPSNDDSNSVFPLRCGISRLFSGFICLQRRYE